MDWDPQKLHDAERLLNRGQPSGPRMDALWERVKPTIQKSPAPGLHARLAWIFAPLAAAAAAVVLFVSPQSQFRERGGTQGAVSVEASCGGPDQPCRVGEPVFFRVGARGEPGVAQLLLLSASGPAWLEEPLVVQPNQGETPLKVKVVPDAGDVQNGLTVQVFWSAVPFTELERKALLRGEDLLHPQQVLTLEVRP